MIIRITNIILGIALIMISLMTAIPLTIKLIRVGPLNGFNFGFIFLPITLVLSLSTIFGFLAFLDFQKHYHGIKKTLIGTYIIIGMIVFGTVLMIPEFTTIAIIVLTLLIIATNLTKQNLGLYLLFNNGLIVAFMLWILLLLMTSDEGYKIEQLLEIWK